MRKQCTHIKLLEFRNVTIFTQPGNLELLQLTCCTLKLQPLPETLLRQAEGGSTSYVLHSGTIEPNLT